MLQRELNELMQECNIYKIRKRKDRLCPPGIPEDNFLFPERQGREIDKSLMYTELHNYQFC